MAQLEAAAQKCVFDETNSDRILEKGLSLLEQIKQNDINTLVFLDKAARPYSWLTDFLWARHYPAEEPPGFLHLNIGGEKKLREKYMHGRGSAISESDGRRFCGIYDSPRNIARFDKNVRADTATQQRLTDELGSPAAEALHDQKIIIVDDIEFQGVSRMFTEAVLEEVYSPASIEYFSFETELDGAASGLTDDGREWSFLATRSSSLEDIDYAVDCWQAMARLALRSQLPAHG